MSARLERRPTLGRSAANAVGNGAKGVAGAVGSIFSAPGRLIRRLSRRNVPSLSIAVAVDNSRLADKGIDLACDFLRAAGQLTLMHVIVDINASDHRGVKTVRSKAEARASQNAVNNVEWVETMRRDRRSPLVGDIVNLFSGTDCDLLMLGSGASRKEDNHVINSTHEDDLVLLQCPRSVCFVKLSSPAPQASRIFVLATSICGLVFRQAFDDFLAQYVRSGDVVDVFYARSDPLRPDSLKYYQEGLRSAGISGECILNEMSPGEHPSEVMSQYAQRKGADYLVFGIEPYKDIRQLYGTAPDECSRIARTNVLILKVFPK